jgi:hypothetical protein
MPLTLFEAWLGEASSARLQDWTYRVGIYIVINVLDDPAWLAFMFC